MSAAHRHVQRAGPRGSARGAHHRQQRADLAGIRSSAGDRARCQLRVLGTASDGRCTPTSRSPRRSPAALLGYVAFGDARESTWFAPQGGVRGQLAEALRASRKYFAVAHEFGHVIGGHVGGPATRLPTPGWEDIDMVAKSVEQENEADRIASLIVSRLDGVDTDPRAPPMVAAGPAIFFALARSVELRARAKSACGVVAIPAKRTTRTAPSAPRRHDVGGVRHRIPRVSGMPGRVASAGLGRPAATRRLGSRSATGRAASSTRSAAGVRRPCSVSLKALIAPPPSLSRACRLLSRRSELSAGSAAREDRPAPWLMGPHLPPDVAPARGPVAMPRLLVQVPPWVRRE